MSSQRVLGRGLSALIPTGQSVYREVPVSAVEVNPLQPRQHFDVEELKALTESVRQVGILQPIVVRETGIVGQFEIIAGERRWRAATDAGLDTIPVVVRAADDEASLAAAVIENVHRADLNPVEEAAAFRQLIDDFGLTHEDVGDRMGRSRTSVTNALRLLTLPATVQRYIMDGELAAGHARALLGCPDPTDLELLAEQVVEQGWTVRQVEDAVREMNAPPSDKPESNSNKAQPGKSTSDERPAAVVEVESSLSAALATSVEVRTGARGGQIVIRFADDDDLGRIYDAINGNLKSALEG